MSACECGHEKKLHGPEGCFADWGSDYCECQRFVPRLKKEARP
ncbi:hypothetical protein LCGC14_1972600 [marine sediment metagenome]|uniref:Uncharacterized protein n=1 Tax=marine sediment metagenome TaxID=412755 RepID=A0A0F9FB87_9ZZZZ